MSQKEDLLRGQIGDFELCYNKSIIQSNGLWRAENALTSSLPLFVTQLSLIILMNRITMLVLKPLRQPRIISEILGGVLMGLSGLSAMEFFRNIAIPFKGIWTLETVANLSLVYYMFLVGLETDLTLILHAGRKAYCVALTGIVFAMPAGYGLFYLIQPNPSYPGGSIFWAIALACTNFPDLARILADAKLLRFEMGQTALASALINDFCCWVFLVVLMAFLEMGMYISVASTIAFTLLCVFAVRPALKWTLCHITKEDNYEEYHVGFILIGVILFGFIADACGAHSIAGAFMFGVIMPKGELKDTLMEKVEDFVSGTMLPLFFLVIGIRVDLRVLAYGTSWAKALMIIALACTPKILSTCLVSLFYSMPALEGLALGLLMNTKGLLSLIILSSGRDRKALDNQTFSIMVVAFWVMTFVIGPILACSYKHTRCSRQYKGRTIQSAEPDTEFRILVCVHALPNVSSVINLLQASNPTELSPICVFAVHLVELTGRASAMLIVHDTCNKSSDKGGAGRTKAQSDVASAFESLESRNNGISVHPLTAVSAYESMHEDICCLAEDKHVILILIPFHKQPTIDGEWEDTNPALRGFNQNVLANAPCSVGIFVDRGLSSVSTTRRESDHGNNGQRFAMLYIGGPDDREALAYAWRLSGHPAVSLDVMRFVPGDEQLNRRDQNHQGDHYDHKERILTNKKDNTDHRDQKQLDDEYLAQFRQASACNPSITYMEKVVNNGEETLKTLSTMEYEYDLYIVGRREGMVSPLTSGLTEWSDCPELGALGDALVSSSFASDVSVLIVKQRGGGGTLEMGNGEQELTGRLKEHFGHITWQPHLIGGSNADKELFTPCMRRL